jgi:hypothetical protein
MKGEGYKFLSLEYENGYKCLKAILKIFKGNKLVKDYIDDFKNYEQILIDNGYNFVSNIYLSVISNYMFKRNFDQEDFEEENDSGWIYSDYSNRFEKLEYLEKPNLNL